MNRYDPQLLYDLRKSTTQLKDIKPLELTLTQFYVFMLQRYLLKKTIPIIHKRASDIVTLLDMLETRNSNPLFVYIQPNITYLPDANVTWSINKYEGN